MRRCSSGRRGQSPKLYAKARRGFESCPTCNIWKIFWKFLLNYLNFLRILTILKMWLIDKQQFTTIFDILIQQNNKNFCWLNSSGLIQQNAKNIDTGRGWWKTTAERYSSVNIFVRKQNFHIIINFLISSDIIRALIVAFGVVTERSLV